MGKTLDYDSVKNWMRLAVLALIEYQDNPPATDIERLGFLRGIAHTALDMAFSLRAGYRADAIRDLLLAIAPGDEELLAFFDDVDRDQWLTHPGARRTN